MTIIKDKHKVILIVSIIFILLIIYFRPKTLWDRLGLSNIDPNEIVYCYFFDISQGGNADWSGSAYELLGQHNKLFGGLFHEVSTYGPVLYKNAVVNPDLINLYISVARENGEYSHNTIELILSHGYNSDDYSAFINIDKRGYLVTADKSSIALFIQKAREIITDSPSLPEKVVD